MGRFTRAQRRLISLTNTDGKIGCGGDAVNFPMNKQVPVIVRAAWV